MKLGSVPRNLWLDPQFKALHPHAKLIALYLLTCPYGNSAHIFRVGPAEIAVGCGIGTKATRSLLSEIEKVGLLAYDFEYEIAWLEKQMLAELGPALKPEDKRVPYLRKLAAELPATSLAADFIERYGIVYHLKIKGASEGASMAPSRGHARGFEAKDKGKGNARASFREGICTEPRDSTTCTRGDGNEVAS